MVSTKQSEQLFTLQSGTPEVDGNFMLSLSSGADKRQIILTGINEEIEAPWNNLQQVLLSFEGAVAFLGSLLMLTFTLGFLLGG